MAVHLLPDDACQGIQPVEQLSPVVTCQSDINFKKESQAAQDVARTLQQCLSQGRTLEESLLQLFVQARKNHATADSRMPTTQAVRVGFKLWRCRQKERLALRSKIQNWYAQQPRSRTAIADGKLSGLSVCPSPKKRSRGRAAGRKKTTVGAVCASKQETQCKDAAGTPDNSTELAAVCCHTSSAESPSSKAESPTTQTGYAESLSMMQAQGHRWQRINSKRKTETPFQGSDLQPVNQPEGNMQRAAVQQQQQQQTRKRVRQKQPEKEPYQVQEIAKHDVMSEGSAIVSPWMAASLEEPLSKARPESSTAATNDSVQGLYDKKCKNGGHHAPWQCPRAGGAKLGAIGPLDLMISAPSVGLLAQMPGPLGQWLANMENAGNAPATHGDPGAMCKKEEKPSKSGHDVDIRTPPKKLNKRRRLVRGSSRYIALLQLPSDKLKGKSELSGV